MRTYSTLIPFVALAFTFAANAVPTSYSSSGNTYNSKVSVRELDSDVVEARSFVVDDHSLVERSSALSTEEGPTSPMQSNVQSSVERRINHKFTAASLLALGGVTAAAAYMGSKAIKEHDEKHDESSSTSSSAPDPTPTDSGCTKHMIKEGQC
ncbi:hypothetical protein F5051DRAFT_7577 [Lentinula edodes]|nr:hypothetical protein F5051DRAFT_7577 [Lentinula edodes]